MNKKGYMLMVIIIFIICIFVFAIVNFFTYNMYSNIYPIIKEDVTLNESKQVLDDTNTRFPSVFDGLIAIIMVGLWVGGIASAIASDEHPIVFGFTMFTIIFVLIAAMWLSNSYEEMFTDSDLSSLPSTFPFTNWLLTHIVETGIVMAASIVLALLAKNKT